MKEILTLKDVSLIYQTKESETKALDNINFTINEGEFVSIVGPSGCGKTTILSLISGILKPSSGEITIADAIDKKEKTGYMFQHDHLFEWRNIYKNVTLGLEIKHIKDRAYYTYADMLLDKYGLRDFKKSYPSELSGGMRQRVALIRTLTLKPDILLLDEPFSALDFQTRLKVCDDVAEIIKNEKKTAILVTHDITEAISMSDKIIVLTNRPASVKTVFDVPFSKSGTPLRKREHPDAAKLFEKIWKEIQSNEKQTDI